MIPVPMLETLDSWKKRRSFWLAGADSLVEKFWESTTIYGKLECMIEIHEYAKKNFKNSSVKDKYDLNALLAASNQFIKTVSNIETKEDIQSSFLKNIRAKCEIDPFYLPGHLPHHLKEPILVKDNRNKEQTIKIFKKERLYETLKAFSQGTILKVNTSDTKFEILPNAFNNIRKKYIETGKYKNLDHKSTDYKNARYFREQYLKYIRDTFQTGFWPQQNNHDYQTVQHDDLAVREQYRVFIRNGRFFKFIKYKNYLSITPATTYNNSTHGKSNWACFVITNKGEIFSGTHEEYVRHHSSFNQGSFVFYAGEYFIGHDGKLEKLNDFSGHYLPAFENVAAVLGYFKNKGIDISNCELNLTEANVQINAALFLEEFTKAKNNKTVRYEKNSFLNQIKYFTFKVEMKIESKVEDDEDDGKDDEIRQFEKRMEEKRKKRELENEQQKKMETLSQENKKEEKVSVPSSVNENKTVFIEANSKELTEEQRVDYAKRLMLMEICDVTAIDLIEYYDKRNHAIKQNSSVKEENMLDAINKKNELTETKLEHAKKIYGKISDLHKNISHSFDEPFKKNAEQYIQELETIIHEARLENRKIELAKSEKWEVGLRKVVTHGLFGAPSDLDKVLQGAKGWVSVYRNTKDKDFSYDNKLCNDGELANTTPSFLH